MHTPFLLYKSGVQGVYIAWTCYHDIMTKTLRQKFTAKEDQALVSSQVNIKTNWKFRKSEFIKFKLLIMHQSFVSPAPPGPGIAGT